MKTSNITTYTIPAASVREFSANIAKLDRRSQKLGLPPITLSVVEGSARPLKQTTTLHSPNPVDYDESTGGFGAVAFSDSRDTRTMIVECVDVEVDTHTVAFSGWEFIATPEVVGEHTVFHGHDTDLIPDRLRNNSNDCDHCKVKSKLRSHLFILRHTDTSEWVRVGKTCLRDFLGSASAANIAAQFEFRASLDFLVGDYANEANDSFERGEGGRRASITYDFRVIASRAIALTLWQGFVSRGSVRNGRQDNLLPNADYLADWDTTLKNHEGLRDKLPTEQQVDDLIAWLNDQPADNDFMKGLQAYAAIGEVTERGLAMLAALPSSRGRALAKARAAEMKAKSDYVGVVGERAVFTGTVERIISFESQYGVGFVTLIRDEAGNLIKAGALSGALEGETVTFKATIKSHSEYRDEKQTVVSRATLFVPKPPKVKKTKEVQPA